jgi:transmembrane sensor
VTVDTLHKAQQRKAREEAARWVLRTRSADAPVDALDAWLSGGADRATAYAESMQVWQELGQVARQEAPERPRSRLPHIYAALAATMLLCLFVGTHFYLAPDHYQTSIGEQKTIRLADGSRITLNTNTEITVRLEATRREVELVKGEALFEVAHDKRRPFTVAAAGEYVRAVGTAFIVRRDHQKFEVTLLSGAIVVFDDRAAHGSVVSLYPGDRLRWAADGRSTLDRPQLTQVTAWQKNELILDHTRLRDAVAELNRYSVKPIQLNLGNDDGLEVSGIFRSKDNRSFAYTVAQIYALKITETADAIVITR